MAQVDLMPAVMEAQDEVEFDPLIKLDPDMKHSPSSSPAGTPHMPAACGPRRPPRKSTLTQQQKNQKRQRATQDQLSTLEIEFNRNPTPTAHVRERIALDINMTERSVQIWFQNRRAKIKNLAKKSLETGEDCDAIPDSMRKYLALQGADGKQFVRPDLLGVGGVGGSFLDPATSSKVMIYHLACRSLSIGSWRRIGQSQLDLVVFYSPTKAMMTYYIQSDGSGFRVEYPFHFIKSINLDQGSPSASAEDASQQSGGLIVELNRPPLFSMDQGNAGWYPSRDFTEDAQASNILTHHLGGHPKVLAGQLAKLVSLDVFRNRNALTAPDVKPVIDQSSVSPLIPPPIPRPSSQPSNFAHPEQAHVGDVKDPSLMGPPAVPINRGHKRQRSRSVPAGLDFPRRQPIPPFVMHQHHHVHHHVPSSHPHIYAPIPQHASPTPFQQSGATHQFGPPLNTDHPPTPFTFEAPYPASASTVATSPPSDFDGSHLSIPEPHSASHAQLTFNGPFLSPMPHSASTLQPSVSPLSALSHPEPLMATPHPSIERSASADFAIQHQPTPRIVEPNSLFDNSHDLNFEPEYDLNDKIHDQNNFQYYGDYSANNPELMEALLLDDSMNPYVKNNPFTLPFRSGLDDPPFVDLPLPPLPAADTDWEFNDLVDLDRSRGS